MPHLFNLRAASSSYSLSPYFKWSWDSTQSVSSWVDNLELFFLSPIRYPNIYYIYTANQCFQNQILISFLNRGMHYTKTQFCVDRPWKLLPETLHLNCIYKRNHKLSACRPNLAFSQIFLGPCVYVCVFKELCIERAYTNLGFCFLLKL